MIANTFQKVRREIVHQSNDESLIELNERSTLKQFFSLKPIKRGIKIWHRCNSFTGNIFDIIYSDKETDSVDGSVRKRDG